MWTLYRPLFRNNYSCIFDCWIEHDKDNFTAIMLCQARETRAKVEVAMEPTMTV